MRKISFLLAILCFFGCTQHAWTAKIYMVKAEEAFSKGHAMRIHKGDATYETRLKYYRKACDYFSKAYDINRETFTLSRIDEAMEACLRIEDFKHEETFREFEEEYARTHPDEAKYGDAGAFMNLES